MKEVIENGVRYIEYDEEPSNSHIAPLPCPFCGGRAKAIHHHYKSMYQGLRTAGMGLSSMPARTLWTVMCKNSKCPVKPFVPLCEDKEDAINKWNTRLTHTPLIPAG